MLISGIFVDEVFRVTGAIIEGGVNGGSAVISNSNSLPGRTVFNSALKERLVHCTSDKASGSSRLLTIRTMLVSLVWVSLETLKTAIVGANSIGFQTVPLNWRTMLDWPGSLHVTVADFATAPPKLAELNSRGMEPVLPGSICLSQVPAVVQPQPGRTSMICKVAVPMLVNTKSCFTTTPELTLPKSYTSSAN